MSNIRPLCDALAKKAATELNETPESITEGLAAIKEWLIRTPHIKSRTDDQFLVTFLRGCKFSLEKVKEKLEMYYTVRAAISGFNLCSDPADEKMVKLFKTGMSLTLPRSDEPDAPIVTLIRTTYDPNEVLFMDILEFANLTCEYTLFADDNFVVAGQIYVYDLEHLTMTHILQLTPSILKQMLLLFEKSLPIRMKAVHIINAPSAFTSIFNIMKPLLTEKLKQRVFVHSTMNDLWAHLPKQIFPSEYGGNGGPISHFIEQLQNNVTSARTQLLDNRNYGIDETKRIGKLKKCQWTDGVVGSFQKLVVD